MDLENQTLLLTIGFLLFVLFLLGFRLLRLTARNARKQREPTSPAELLFDTLREKTLMEQQASRESLEAKTALASLDALHRTIMAHLPSGLLVIDANQIIHFANQQALSLFDREAMVGTQLRQLHVGLAESVTRLRTGDMALTDGFEISWNGETRYIEASVAVLPDEQWLVSLLDKSRERRLEADIRTKRDLELMGEMAAGVAHEVKNALATMQGHLQMLPYGDLKEHAGFIQAEIDSLLRMVRQYMTSSKGDGLALENLAIDDWLADLQVYWAQHPKGSEVHIEGHQTGVEMRADRHALKTVIDNLILNGLQSGSEGEVIEVHVHLKVLPQQVLLTVADTGPGFPETVKSRLFTPFVSSKQGGSGLGLFHCRKIVMEHGGRLEVETGPPTRVLCYLPR